MEKQIDADAAALVMQIMAQNSKDASYISNQLVDAYQKTAERNQAIIDAIRWKMRRLFDSGYQPSESSIVNALWPSEELIEEFLPKDYQ